MQYRKRLYLCGFYPYSPIVFARGTEIACIHAVVPPVPLVPPFLGSIWKKSTNNIFSFCGIESGSRRISVLERVFLHVPASLVV
jgi:hypothetical protein